MAMTRSEPLSFNIDRIQQLLPHRYPFLLVDRVVEIEPMKRLVSIKNVTMNEPFFTGHFPGVPVMPGVLVIEAMAQTGALLLLHHDDGSMRDKYMVLAGVDGARFRRLVVPGDQLRMEIEVVSVRSRYCKVQARATVDGQLAAEAELLSMIVDLEGKRT